MVLLKLHRDNDSSGTNRMNKRKENKQNEEDKSEE